MANTASAGHMKRATSYQAAKLTGRPAKPASVKAKRPSNANAAPFDATDRNAATSAAAPSNTSGHQKWNGTAANLNPKPTRMRNVPSNSTGSNLAPGAVRAAANPLARSGK